MTKQGTHSSEPSAQPAQAPKRKRQRWTREEEQELANILFAHPEWTDDLFPNRRNGEPPRYFKSHLAKHIAAQIKPNDPPTATAVLYKINSMERRFSDWRHQKSQAGLRDGAPLANSSIHAEHEPWFGQFEKLLSNKQDPQGPEVRPERASQGVASSPTPSCSDPRRQQSQDASDSLGLTAPLVKKRKISDSISSDWDSISSSSSSQDDRSDTSFEALMEASDRRIKTLELQCEQARQKQIALIPKLFREMDDVYDDVEEHLLDSMKVMILQNLLQSI